MNTNTYVLIEIQHRITLTKSGYFGLNRQLRSKVIPRGTKTKLYKYLINNIR